MTISDAQIALQRRAARLVSQEVNACMSSLVATLAAGYGDTGNPVSGRRSDLASLTEQALELASPVLDYEGAAREAGYDVNDFSDSDEAYWFKGDDHDEEGERVESVPAAWRDCCEANDLEPHEIEVYEHWAVSSWLAEKLIAKGERVDTDFAGLNVWARTTTGQAISMDSVIEAITTETGYASGGEA